MVGALGYLSAWKDETVRAVLDVAGSFVENEVTARLEEWEQRRSVSREVWAKAGEAGLLCCSIPEEYGGGGRTIARLQPGPHPRQDRPARGNEVLKDVVARSL